MIKRVSHVNVFVLDQDRAKRFYTEQLGFEVRNDSILDDFRWLTVGPKEQPDLAILLAYRDRRLPSDLCRACREGRDLPAGTGGPALWDRGALPR